MKNDKHIRAIIAVLLSVTAARSVCAGTVNTWRGNDVTADWNESYKWNLHHPPSEREAVHFRQENSIISVNSTVQLDNGMHLYGEELLLKGNGNINLWSQIPHERTVNIPASSSGFANLTLCDNLSLNGCIALSAKGYGTSASKGTISLKDRSTVTGALVIGNEGVGSGQVIVMDNATFRITSLELNTEAEKGGLAEIHIMGGTVNIENDDRILDLFMADTSRKIILGDMGTLRIESRLTVSEKQEMLNQLIASKRLIAAPGCRLCPPILQDEMLIARAEDIRVSTGTPGGAPIRASIDSMPPSAPAAPSANPIDRGALVQALHMDVNSATNKLVQSQKDAAVKESNRPHMAGYIVFMGTILLVLRKPSDG